MITRIRTNCVALCATLTFFELLIVPARAGTFDEKIIEVPAPAEPGPWQFIIEPYGWLTSLDGTTGAKGLTTNVDFSVDEVLDNLDFAFFLQGEVRYMRWGILANGYYAELSGVSDPPGPFYSSTNTSLQQGLVELALAYRLVEGKHGFIDAFAGARYNYLGLDISANIDTNGIQTVSENASRHITERAENVADRIVATAAADIEEELRVRVADEVTGRVRSAWEDLPAGIQNFLRRPGVSDVLREVADERAELAAAIVESRLVAAEEAARARAENRVEEAEQDLADALSKEIKKRMRENAADNKQWVDPFVGIRGQLNVTSRLFLAARADIGGFGVSSDLVWQVTGSVGYKLTKNVFTEVGYRYLDDDYTDGGFTYDMATSGAYIGLGVVF